MGPPESNLDAVKGPRFLLDEGGYIQPIANPAVFLVGSESEWNGFFPDGAPDAIEFPVIFQIIDLQELRDVVFIYADCLDDNRSKIVGLYWNREPLAGRQNHSLAGKTDLGQHFRKNDFQNLSLREVTPLHIAYPGINRNCACPLPGFRAVDPYDVLFHSEPEIVSLLDLYQAKKILPGIHRIAETNLHVRLFFLDRPGLQHGEGVQGGNCNGLFTFGINPYAAAVPFDRYSRRGISTSDSFHGKRVIAPVCIVVPRNGQVFPLL